MKAGNARPNLPFGCRDSTGGALLGDAGGPVSGGARPMAKLEITSISPVLGAEEPLSAIRL